MVNFSQLKGISPQAVGSQAAQLQAIQTAVAGELDKKQALYSALGRTLPSLISAGNNFLDRRAEAKAAKAKQLALQGYNDAQIDLMLGSQLGGIGDPGYEGQAPLELKSYPLDEVADANRIQQTEPGKFSVGIDNGQAMTTPGINPQIESSMRRIAKYGGLAGIPQGDIRASLAYSQYSPEGLKDRYTAEEARAEYKSKEGSENTGVRSRRNLERDLGLQKNRADIANVYDTINKRVQGGSGSSQAKIAKQAGLIGSVMNDYVATLNDINKLEPTVVGRLKARSEAEARLETEAGRKSKALSGLRKRLRTEIARLSDVGNLTEQEQATAEGLLPNPLDRIDQQQESLSLLQNYLSAKAESNINIQPILGAEGGQAESKTSLNKKSIFKRIDELEKKARK